MRLKVRRQPPFLATFLDLKKRGTDVTVTLDTKHWVRGRVVAVDQQSGDVVILHHERPAETNPQRRVRRVAINLSHVREVEWGTA